MTSKWIFKLCIALSLCALTIAVTGCDQAPPEPTPPPAPVVESKHGAWWCPEHGVPEEECSICDPEIYKQFKAKGDICPKHQDRAKSQCFICNPDLLAQARARYFGKIGKQMPVPKDNMPPEAGEED